MLLIKHNWLCMLGISGQLNKSLTGYNVCVCVLTLSLATCDFVSEYTKDRVPYSISDREWFC